MTEQDFLMKVLPTWPQDLLLFRWSMHNDLVAVRWMTPEGFEVRVDYAIKPNVELLHDGGFSYHGNLDVTVSNLCGSYIDLGVQLALHWRGRDIPANEDYITADGGLRITRGTARVCGVDGRRDRCRRRHLVTGDQFDVPDRHFIVEILPTIPFIEYDSRKLEPTGTLYVISLLVQGTLAELRVITEHDEQFESSVSWCMGTVPTWAKDIGSSATVQKRFLNRTVSFKRFNDQQRGVNSRAGQFKVILEYRDIDRDLMLGLDYLFDWVVGRHVTIHGDPTLCSIGWLAKHRRIAEHDDVEPDGEL